MKTLYSLLGYCIWVVVGAFVGSCAALYWQHLHTPALFEAWSAPWYTPILTRGLMALAALVILFLLRALLRQRMERK